MSKCCPRAAARRWWPQGSSAAPPSLPASASAPPAVQRAPARAAVTAIAPVAPELAKVRSAVPGALFRWKNATTWSRNTSSGVCCSLRVLGNFCRMCSIVAPSAPNAEGRKLPTCVSARSRQTPNSSGFTTQHGIADLSFARTARKRMRTENGGYRRDTCGRSPNGSKSIRKGCTSWDRRARLCAHPSPLQAQKRRVLACPILYRFGAPDTKMWQANNRFEKSAEIGAAA